MRDGLRRSAGLALLLGILCAPPGRAQEPATSRPWSDPPAKPAEAQAAKPAPVADASAAAPERAASPAATTVSRPRKAERPALARRKAERRERVAARPNRRTGAEASRRQPLARGVVPVRRCFGTGPVRLARPLPPDFADDRGVDLWVDARANRIRRAGDGGFLVMRRATVEGTMGRRMPILPPLDDEDE
ncbi:hypothetical protein ACQVP2_25165 [Methylobacterium aquaticum]|uniref:hypothetical protein n=1 Tax=Methylobacterium aquaticum TaxID=270351 RepID=UPI003D16598B